MAKKKYTKSSGAKQHSNIPGFSGDESDKKTKEGGMVFHSISEHIQEPFLIITALAALLSVGMIANAIFIDVSTESALSSSKTVALICTAILAVAGIAAAVLTGMYYQKGRNNIHFILITLLLLLSTLFAYRSYDLINGSSYFEGRDYAIFAFFLGISGLFYTLWMHRVLSTSTSLIVPIAILALLIHMAPAYTPSYATWQGKYIADLDSYFRFRNADTILKTQYTPEKETLVYPSLPVNMHSDGTIDSNIDFAGIKFGFNVFLASVTGLLAPYGFTITDMAMIAPGILSVFVVILLFYLLKELFSDMEPYNYAATGLGALMLAVNVSFSTKAIATNCDIDTFGMFTTLGAFLLLTLSYRRKSISLAFLAGLGLMFLNMSWTGYSYAVLVLGLMGMVYPVVSFINKKSAVEHIPYFVITLLTSHLAYLVLRHRAVFPEFSMPENIFLLPFGGMLFISFLLEAIRNSQSKTSAPISVRLADRIEGALQKFSLPVFVLILLCSMFYVFFISSPGNIMAYTAALTQPPIQKDIIEQTTAEQKVLCDGVSMGECINKLRSEFGLAVLFGIGMIFVLAYYMLAKRSFGAMFVLMWSLPIFYGVIFKSQFHFAASVPIVALGSTIGLVIALSRKDLQSFRVVPLLILVSTPLMILLFSGGMPIFGPFGGATPMYMGASGDRIFWQGTFDWLKLQPNTIVLTWWDYGHWITAMTGKVSILDGNKADRFMVKDIARFHVLSENESEALDIAKKYKASVVVIDWTMIGKSGAPHFIATGGFGENIPLKQIGAKVDCVKGSNCDIIRNGGAGDSYATTYIDPNNANNSGYIIIDLTFDYPMNSITLHLPDDGSKYGYRVDLSDDKVNWHTVADKTETDMNGTQTNHFKQESAQYIKITGTYASTGGDFKLSGADIFTPYSDGSYMGYGQCEFNPSAKYSTIKATPQQNNAGGFDMVNRLYFGCNNGLGLIFDIKNGAYSADNVYVVNQGQMFPWKSWKENTGASILGVQSLKDILGNALNYPTESGQVNRFIDFPTFDTLVYVPKSEGYNFNNVMMTKLYLGDHLEEYQQALLADSSIEPAKYFTLADGFMGDKEDYSYYGYVRAYNINYPENMTQ